MESGLLGRLLSSFLHLVYSYQVPGVGLGISDFCNHGLDYDCSMSVKLSLAYIYNIIMGAVGMSTQSKAGICINDEHNYNLGAVRMRTSKAGNLQE